MIPSPRAASRLPRATSRLPRAAYRAPLAALGVLAVVLFPDGALACPGCIAGTEENRVAFLVTTGLLSFLPLMMIGGVIYWLRKRARRLEEEAAHA